MSIQYPASIELSDLDGTNGFVLDGEWGTSVYSGNFVSGAGDINGDGISDLIVGATQGGNGAGKSYVVFGKSSAWSASLNISTLDGSDGFVINGEAVGDASGKAVSTAGDINGDGLGDLIVGAPYADPGGRNSAGKSYVVFGKISPWSVSLELSALDGSNGFVINGEALGDASGAAVSAGDINGDGLGDLIIGAPAADPGGRLYAGRSYVVFGQNSVWPASLELSTLDGSNGFVLNGETGDRYTGLSVSSAGDINGDGVSDLIVGAPGFWPGKSYVVFGKSGVWSASLELSTLDGSDGFVLNGEVSDDRCGWSVSGAGDINGDGIDDLIVGAYHPTPGSLPGRSYVVFGKSSAWSPSIELSGLDGSDGFVINGEAEFDSSGFSVSAAGDINADGIADLMVGAPGASPGNRTDVGKIYVVFGRYGAWSWPASLELSTLDGGNGFVINGHVASIGGSINNAGDINSDGIDDLIIGTGGTRNYVVFGGVGQGITTNSPMTKKPGLVVSDANRLSPTFAGINTALLLGRTAWQMGKKGFGFSEDVLVEQEAIHDAPQLEDSSNLVNPEACTLQPVDLPHEHADYTNQSAMPFDSGTWDPSPAHHPDTGAPVFTYRVFSKGLEVGSAEFYKHPLLCRSEDGARHNIMKLTGVLSEFDLESKLHTVEDVCEALPPAFIEQVTATSMRAAEHGAVRGVANVVAYGMQAKGFSEQAASYAHQGVYYGSMYTLSYLHHYSQLDDDTPEVQKMASAAYQATWDMGSLFLTNMALRKSCEAAAWMGDAASKRGWSRTGRALGFLSQYGGYGVYMRDSITRGPAHAAASLVSGMATQKTVETVGKGAVDHFLGSHRAALEGRRVSRDNTTSEIQTPMNDANNDCTMPAPMLK